MTPLVVALWLNIAVLVPVVTVMLFVPRLAIRLYGQVTPARGVVLALYLTLIATSVLFLVWPLEPGIITLLAVQVSYKVLSAFTIRVLTSPLVIGNLLIAAIQTGLLVLHSMPA